MNKWKPPNEFDCPYLTRTGSHLLGIKVYTRSWKNLFRKKFYKACLYCELLVEIDE